MQPRQMRETSRPVWPSLVYSIIHSYADHTALPRVKGRRRPEMALEQLVAGVACVFKPAAVEPTLIVILSDINMPGMDGLQLLEAIKYRLPAPLVMMTV